MKPTILALCLLALARITNSQDKKPQFADKIQVALNNTKPLAYDRGKRLPLFLWPAMDPGELSDEEAEYLVRELDSRGIGLVCSWSPEEQKSLPPQALTVARAQKRMKLSININATDLLYSFFNGDARTAHIDEDGKRFFDDSFGTRKMGCPFAINFRKKEVRERVNFFVKKYAENDLDVNFIFADWEVDGPLEVNHAFEASKKCARCKDYLGDNFSFLEFQKRLREMRSYLQYYAFSAPVLACFPETLIGNYAVYPHDGYRYWYDYFEYYVQGQPFKADQRAKYRKWYNDFPSTGYTCAMPVIYPWAPIYNWYDFDNPDYKWFYNMLLVASNAGKNTSQNIPIISFVHWHTVFYPHESDPAVTQMSRESYQELLWHMLLRGTDTFFMWSGKNEFPEEVRLVHEVYAEAQGYGKFLEQGLPITYDVPKEPETVVSGLALGDSVLVRRTDFGDNQASVEVIAGTKAITVKYTPGICQLISLASDE